MKIICTINGPKQSQESSLECDFSFAPFSTQTRSQPLKTPKEIEFGSLIKSALLSAVRMQEKTSIEVNIIVLECDGLAACLGHSVTCASLALIDAGIEMSDSVIGASVGIIGKDSILNVDCSDEDELNQSGYMFLAYMPNTNQVAHILQSGEVSVQTAIKSMEVCIDTCVQVYSVIQKIIVQTV